MLKVAVLVSLVVLALTGSADAQTPLLEVSQQTAPFGTSQVVVSVVGTPLQFFAVGRSTASSGLVAGGVSLQLGTDATLAGSGQLDAQGLASFTLTLAPGPSTVHLQGFTAPDVSFAGFVPSPGKTVTVLAAAPAMPAAPPRLFTAGVTVGGTNLIGFAALQGSSGPLSPVPPGFPVPTPNFQLVPAACTAQSLQVRTAPALLVAESVTITLVVEGTDTLTCTVPAGSAACNSAGAAQVIAAGSLAGFRVNSTTGMLPPVSVAFGFVCT